MRFSCVALVTLAACANGSAQSIDPFLDLDKADGQKVHLEYDDRSKLDMDEPSDLVRVGDQLFAVSDAHSKIYEITPDGDTYEYLNIDGHDLEALAYDPHRHEFMIADEATAKIWTIDESGGRHDSIELKSADDANSGIEGLVVASNGHLFAAKEKDPSRIYELDGEGNTLDSKKVDFAKDISAITFNPTDEHLYALSDEDHALFRLDRSWKPDRGWKLPIEHPEGVAFDGDILYVVSDSEHRIYTFHMEL